ncbi:MAG TPA: hypothetical protein VLV89_05580 [Candidatus Acidoferrum sp.]|nr:hypothetical protein [Candidatus Acidoferrum sp.]
MSMDLLTEKLRRDGNLVGMKTRPARALIGWMPEREAQILLGIPHTPVTPLPEHVRRVEEARAAVRARPAGVDQKNILSDIGEELLAYSAEFQNQPSYKPFRAIGCTIRMANLNEICALQPLVHLDYLEHAERFRNLVQQAVQDDMISLARIALPISAPAELAAQFDRQKNAWIHESSNPDARIVGPFNARVEVAPGLFAMGYGFCIAPLPSFVQVVLYRGRYFLKDGYHRTLALLQKGITRVPVVFQEILESQNLDVEGRFSDEIILGPHPPLLPDYLRDDVAAAGLHLAIQKTIVIQSTENQTWG